MYVHLCIQQSLHDFGLVAFNIFGANFDRLTASSEKSVPVSALKEDKMNENVRHEIDERLVF